MIESLVKPTTLDNDIAVMKIIQLMGQLSLHDIKHVVDIATQVYNVAILAESQDKS